LRVFGFRPCIFFCYKTTPVSYKYFGLVLAVIIFYKNVYVANKGWRGDVAYDADVSFHMLWDQNKKTKSAEGPNPKIHRKLHLLTSFPLLHHLQHIFIKLHGKPRKTQKFINIHNIIIDITTLVIHQKFIWKIHLA